MSTTTTDNDLKDTNKEEEDNDWDIVSDVASVHSVATTVDNRSESSWSLVDDQASLQSVPDDREKSFSFAEIARMNKVFQTAKQNNIPLSRNVKKPLKSKKEKQSPQIKEPFYDKYDFDAPHAMKYFKRKGVRPKFR